MKLQIYDWGLLDYHQALERMTRLQKQRINNQISDSLILVEHPPTITLGRKGGTFYVPMEKLKAQGVQVVNVGRAGEATAHNPGQVVIYPIIHLKQAKLSPRYLVEDIVNAFVEATRAFDVDSYADLEERVGVWVGKRKLAAIGMQITEGVTMHGIALNINNDIDLFSCIDACGQGRSATSMSKELWGRKLPIDDVRALCVKKIEEYFLRRQESHDYQEQPHLPQGISKTDRLNY